MIFADKLICLRKKAGWSQEELAERLSVTRQSVSKWEGAQSFPDIGKIVQLSQLFGVSTDYLLKDEMEQADSAPCEGDSDGRVSCVRDSIVWGNVTPDGEVANYDANTWWDWDGSNDVERAVVRFENSCTWPLPLEVANAGNIASDPRLVDVANGDLRVRVGSPCLDGAGNQTMGARLADPVDTPSASRPHRPRPAAG